jgi:hypothetical protein
MAQPSRNDSAKMTTFVTLIDGPEALPIRGVFPTFKRVSFEAGRVL